MPRAAHPPTSPTRQELIRRRLAPSAPSSKAVSISCLFFSLSTVGIHPGSTPRPISLALLEHIYRYHNIYLQHPRTTSADTKEDVKAIGSDKVSMYYLPF